VTDEGDVVLVEERGEAAATEGAVALASAPATVDLSPAVRTGPSEPTGATVTELPGFRLGNRPPLTGIRALVIGSILVYHSNLANPHSDFTALPGAWAAISVFFVLSGFLITSMLMAERESKGRISLRNFYTRRALRLLPPLAITIGLLAIYAAVVYVPYAHQRVWADISAAAFYYADFRSASGHEFFLGYLGQAWSLSIEEQFYVIWAALILVASIFHRRIFVYALAISGIALSAAFSIIIIMTGVAKTGGSIASLNWFARCCGWTSKVNEPLLRSVSTSPWVSPIAPARAIRRSRNGRESAASRAR